MSLIPDDFIQTLIDRVDIVEVVSQYVQLKKGGINYLGLCPFHQEKTPSFTVSPTKQFYYCFGCGANGTALGFVMRHLGLSFPGAVKLLADSVGMQVPKPQYSPQVQARIKAQKHRHDVLREALEQAQQFYHQQLSRYAPAQQYLKQRGLSQEVITRFGLGWTGSESQNLRRVFSDYESETLADNGLVVVNERGLRYDRFRGRITFPIYDSRGRLIGFGGRLIRSGEPKYLNSPETELFHKGRELYGLWENRQSIRKANVVLVVEGYMDVVSLSNHGIDYAVATLGTACSEEHIAKLIRHSHRIVFSFDGDRAGRQAAWRALMTCLPLLRDDVVMRFLFLPANHDPDSYVQAEGVPAFEKQIEQAQSLSGFLLEQVGQDFNLDEAEGRSACLNKALPLIDQMPLSTLRTQIENELARLVRFTPAEFDQALARFQAAKAAYVRPGNEATQQQSPRAASQSAVAGHSHQHQPVYGGSTMAARKPSYQRGSSQASELRVPNESNARQVNRYADREQFSSVLHRTTRAQQAPALAQRLLLLLSSHPELLDRVTERQLEILRQHPNMGYVVKFLAFAQTTGARSLAALIEQSESQHELHEILVSLSKENSSFDLLENPVDEWQDAIRRIELDNLNRELSQLTASASDMTDEARQRYLAVTSRIKSLKR